MSSRTLFVIALVSGLTIGAASHALADDRSAANAPLAAARQSQAETLYRQGLLQYEKGDLAAAIALYDDALILDPTSAEAYSARAGAQGRQGNYEAAIEDYSSAIALNDELAAAYGGRGLAFALAGDPTRGVQDLWTAAQLFRQQDRPEQYSQTLAIIRNLAP
ncbi:MAG: tetratricopeptide repeat protein [Leptolyngbyaceae cyanobacterium]|mgnify:CR=1 FL=1